jgi:predicted LPLAT superfamily acyltransferase
MSENSSIQEWVVRPERGSLPLIKLGVRIALRIGRPLARLFLYPICLYFLASSAVATRCSRQYLARVLGRRPRLADVFRHYLTFAACLLDRVYLLNDQIDCFDIRIHGEDIVRDIERRGGGCMLFGAHLGSFEAARAVGRRRRDLPISLLMYEENAQKTRAALAAINPRLETEVIGLGRLESIITTAERLRSGHFVGLLADRNVDGKDLVDYSFLGTPASFPQGPFRMAMLLQRPVVMMVGLYRGGRRYEVFFETLTEASDTRPPDSEAWLDATMRRYVERLEHYCRAAPFNWFNFFDFWRDFGRKLGIAWLCLGLATAALARPTQADPVAWGLPQLMHELAQVGSVSGRFDERKTIHILSSPLLASGTLTYVAPDRLTKTTLTPMAEYFSLDRGQLTFTGADHQAHTVSLAEVPQIAGLIEGIRATLAGDLPALKRYYDVELAGGAAHWQLLLTPKQDGLAHFVKWLRIEGDWDHIEAVNTDHGNGDHSEMNITEDVHDVR